MCMCKDVEACRSVVCLFREEKVNVNISRGSKDVERLVWAINFDLKPWSASKDVHELRYWRWSLTRRVRYQRQFATPQEVLRFHCDIILFWKENRDIILFSKAFNVISIAVVEILKVMSRVWAPCIIRTCVLMLIPNYTYDSDSKLIFSPEASTLS